MRCPSCKLENPPTGLRCDCGFDFQTGKREQVDQASSAPAGEWVSQRRVNELLGRGVFFSLTWLMGIGSLVALLKGLEARRLIVGSNGRLTGTGGAWWCILFGAIGAVVWIPLVLAGMFNVLR